MNPNYSYLYNNLSPENKKYTNTYRALSPVVIKTFGGNNFIYERKYKPNFNYNNEIFDSEYDYIENELKKTKGIKAHTAYTELSTQENMSLFSSQMQNPIKRNYKNYTNISNDRGYSIYPGYDKCFLNERNDNKTRTYIGDNTDYRYKILKKEEISEIFYPNEKTIKKTINYQNYKKQKNKPELISQSFSTSIIPEKKSINNHNNKNNIFEIKYIKSKKSFPNKEINLRISNNDNIKRELSFSKSKNQLADFNIDKLKEIGDKLDMKYLNKTSFHKNNNIKSLNNTNEKSNLSIDNKENKLVKNMIIIEEKRKNSKNKNNLLMKSSDDIKNELKKHHFIENKNKIKTPNKTDKIDIYLKDKDKEKNNKIKIINIEKKNMNNFKVDLPPNTIKIKLKHKIMGKQFNNNIYNSDNKGRRVFNYNINSINKINNSFNRVEKNFNYKNSPIKERIKIKTPDKKIVKSPIKTNIDNIYNNTQKINYNEKFKKIDLNNINHCYLESINIKKNVKTTKTKHSFNDIFLPSQ